MKYQNRVIKKYGSVHRFSRLLNMDYHIVRRKVASEKESDLEWVKEKIKETPNKINPKYEVTTELRDKIRIAIRARYDTYKNFCDKHPEFLPYYISKIVNNNGIGAMTSKVKKLCNTLNIKIHE